MNADVDKFLKNSKQWQREMVKLRSVISSTKLEEELKWNLPCYTYNGANVVIIQPFKACLGLMFFKGALLKDTKKVLHKVGASSQVVRRFEFTSEAEIKKLAPVIKAYIKEAVANENAGKKVVIKRRPEPVPDELIKMFAKKPALKKAFEALTPGRQRAYLMFFSSAKQSTTRQSRIEKYLPHILNGKGMNDR